MRTRKALCSWGIRARVAPTYPPLSRALRAGSGAAASAAALRMRALAVHGVPPARGLRRPAPRRHPHPERRRAADGAGRRPALRDPQDTLHKPAARRRRFRDHKGAKSECAPKRMRAKSVCAQPSWSDEFLACCEVVSVQFRRNLANFLIGRWLNACSFSAIERNLASFSLGEMWTRDAACGIAPALEVLHCMHNEARRSNSPRASYLAASLCEPSILLMSSHAFSYLLMLSLIFSCTFSHRLAHDFLSPFCTTPPRSLNHLDQSGAHSSYATVDAA
eukprot:6174626-Pleurochrysis_carterae.AAC.1